MQTKIPEDLWIWIWIPNQTSSNAQCLFAEHGHLQSICVFFLSHHPFHTVESPVKVKNSSQRYCQPTVGWPSADRRPRDGQPLANSWPAVGRLLVTCWQCVTNTLNNFDGWLSGKSLSLKKSIGSEGSCDMSGHDTWTPTSIFRVSNQKKLATVLKDATSYYNRLLTSTTNAIFRHSFISSKYCSHNEVWCYTEILLKGLLCTSLTTLRPRSVKVR